MSKVENAINSVLNTLVEFPGSTIKEIEFYSGLCEFETYLAIHKLIKLNCIHYLTKNSKKYFYLVA